MSDESSVPPSPAPELPVEPSREPLRRGGTGTAVLGGLLIVVGLVFFVGQWLDIDGGAATWPFYVIAPGLALLAFGLTQPDGSGLTVAGSIVTIVGMVLLYQNATVNCICRVVMRARTG